MFVFELKSGILVKSAAGHGVLLQTLGLAATDDELVRSLVIAGALALAVAWVLLWSLEEADEFAPPSLASGADPAKNSDMASDRATF